VSAIGSGGELFGRLMSRILLTASKGCRIFLIFPSRAMTSADSQNTDQSASVAVGNTAVKSWT